MNSGIEQEEQVIGSAPEFCKDAESGLSNALIVEAILEFLPAVEDLKKIRLLSPTCYALATKKMRKSCQVTTESLEISENFNFSFSSRVSNLARILIGINPRSEWQGLSNERSLSSRLNRTFFNEPDFAANGIHWIRPFAGVKLSRAWKISSAQVRSLFLKFRENIRILSIGSSFVASEDELKMLLTELVPNVELLVLSPHWYSPEWQVDSSRIDKLNVIKIGEVEGERIQLQTVPRICYGIAAAAPNLKGIDGVALPWNIEHCNRLAAVNAGLVKEYSASVFFPHELLPYVEGFAQCRPQLQKLVFQGKLLLWYEGVTEVLLPIPTWCLFHNEILTSSQETLEELKLEGEVEAYDEIRLPVLTNVRSLDFYDLLRFGPKWMPDSTTAVTFPNLFEVVVNHQCATHTENFGTNLLPEDADLQAVSPVNSVRMLKLKCSEGWRDYSFGFLVSKFPRVTQVSVEFRLLTRGVLARPCSLWALSESVETLEIHGVNLERFAYYGLDEWWTGISRRVCAISQRLQRDSLDLERLREFPSILQLKNLKYLYISCVPKNDQPQPSRSSINVNSTPEGPYASNLSRWLVFEQMPNLQVSFMFPSPSPSRKAAMTRGISGLRPISDLIQLLYQNDPL